MAKGLLPVRKIDANVYTKRDLAGEGTAMVRAELACPALVHGVSAMVRGRAQIERGSAGRCPA
ncbi:hypothetical protein P353_04385 [Comamonas testosteroni]|uniref:Uncharacterized protein n=1 Tax=Comamonas testosteroni TaxID=285 RepID=A0A096H2E6_COMTE|nr:hypothetical protein P353_04385 [Comamonas testosteroni]